MQQQPSKEPAVRYFYLRDEVGMPVACVVTLLQNDKVYYTMSVVNPLEKVFDRAKARSIAKGRLDRGRKNVKVTEYSQGLKRRIIEDIANTSIRPRVTAAARLWLLKDHHRAQQQEGKIATFPKVEGKDRFVENIAEMSKRPTTE